jgi:hypothetical protein
LCPACAERPLWGGYGLGGPDTVSGHAGQKTALGNADGNIFFPVRPKSVWGQFRGRDWRCSNKLTIDERDPSLA